ncbi:transposase, partial [Streptomyces koyangensis]|uniref:transposase n=1 Tax=Streptomyces koyangensis TaxID=188770 RepID=UPI003BF4E65F
MRQRRYPSDMTDDEWALIEPLLPLPACDTARGGRPEKHPRREIVDAIRYVVDTGCKWRALPADFPPWRTVWGFMARWAARGVGTCPRVVDTSEPGPGRGRVGGIFYGDEGLLA